jgi:dihydroorotate dehydrogenase
MLYRSLLRRFLFRLPPETAHELALASFSFAPAITKRLVGERFQRSPFGSLRRFGLTFANPVGLAAGFDKDGIALPGLASLGFGFIEAGTVTYHEQSGNPRPRLFRLPLDNGLINRAGFNNQGAKTFAQRVSSVREELNCVLGVSIGKSRAVPLDAAVVDYLNTFALVYPVADYIAVNVSSPNTPGLRELQRPEQLNELLRALQASNSELFEKHHRSTPMPLLVKVSPDLTDSQLREIVDVTSQNKIAGLIATNTTTQRTGLATTTARLSAIGDGGLSGAPLRRQSLRVVATLYNLTGGAVPLIGVGGIFNAEDAWNMISAGASLIQIYTGFIYEGPSILKNINEGLRRIVAREGFVSLDEAVGSRSQHWAQTESVN